MSFLRVTILASIVVSYASAVNLTYTCPAPTAYGGACSCIPYTPTLIRPQAPSHAQAFTCTLPPPPPSGHSLGASPLPQDCHSVPAFAARSISSPAGLYHVFTLPHYLRYYYHMTCRRRLPFCIQAHVPASPWPLVTSAHAFILILPPARPSIHAGGVGYCGPLSSCCSVKMSVLQGSM